MGGHSSVLAKLGENKGAFFLRKENKGAFRANNHPCGPPIRLSLANRDSHAVPSACIYPEHSIRRKYVMQKSLLIMASSFALRKKWNNNDSQDQFPGNYWSQLAV